MAKPKMTFQQMLADGYNYCVDQDCVNVDSHRRYMQHMGWRIYEDGAYELQGHFTNNPFQRGQAGAFMGVQVDLMNSFGKVVDPDGTPIPKAWIENTPMLYDREYNILLAYKSYWSSGKIYYPSATAQPVQYSPSHHRDEVGVRLKVPDPKRVKKLLEDQHVMTGYKVARAAERMCATRKIAEYFGINGRENAMRWLDGGALDKEVEGHIAQLSIDGFKEWLKDVCTKSVVVPYLRLAN